MSQARHGVPSRSGIFALFLTGCLAATIVYFQVVDYLSSISRQQIESQDGIAVNFQVIDQSNEWNWDWNDVTCLDAFAEWLDPLDIRDLEIRLINPQDHELSLPLQAFYETASGHAATAGAWCELAARPRSLSMKCETAPLEAADPDAATTALTGALAQAISYAHTPGIFGTESPAWDWSRWQPLVVPVAEHGWRSACPQLSVEAVHD